MAEAKCFYDNFDPSATKPTSPMEDRIDHFLRGQAGVDYREFTSEVDFDYFDTEDFAHVPMRSLKRLLPEFFQML